MIFLIVLSVFSNVLNDGLKNYVGKSSAKNENLVKNFQLLSFFVCFLICGGLAFFESPSLYSFLLGILFGTMTFVSTHFLILAMGEGPMHITILIATASMLIPTLSGALFFNEIFSAYKFIAILALIVFLYFASSGKSQGKFNWKWLLYCGINFFTGGTIGVIQKIHQSSAHREEFYFFLASAFLVSALIPFFLTLKQKGTREKGDISPKLLGIALVSGLCVFAQYAINTRLSGVLPSQLFFPVINGTNVVFGSVVAVVVFKEKMTKTQIVGMVGGMLSLIAICLLP